MLPRLVTSTWFPPGRQWAGQTLYPFVLVKPWACTAPVLRHELIHCQQVRRVGWWRFYAAWLWQLARGWVRLRSYGAAYRAIGFEAEAYAQQDNAAWLEPELERLVDLWTNPCL